MMSDNIEFKKFVASFEKDARTKIQMQNNALHYRLTFDNLMQAVEKINTSSGKQYMICMGEKFWRVYWDFYQNSIPLKNEVFNWKDHNGMQGALVKALEYIMNEEGK
jgi:hypothetical protein